MESRVRLIGCPVPGFSDAHFDGGIKFRVDPGRGVSVIGSEACIEAEGIQDEGEGAEVCYGHSAGRAGLAAFSAVLRSYAGFDQDIVAGDVTHDSLAFSLAYAQRRRAI